MSAGREKPNIVVFFTDQQRWDTCGCYGQKLPVTPHLDRMAAEGVRFEVAFTPQPVCGPARAVMQTGRYATEVGCPTNHKLLPIDEPTVAKWLAAQGYETAYIGKWHLGSFGPIDGADDFRERPVPRARRGGYEDFWLAADTLEFTSHAYDGHVFDGDGARREFPEGRYRVDVLGDWALEYLESRDGEKPFFLFLSFIEPHHQNDHGCYQGPHGSKERWADYTVPGDLVGTEGDWRENYPDYLGCCNALDENLGRLRAKLEELGRADNTLILFTSDHGSHFRTRNSEYKRACHDACLRVPMVARGPGFTGGKVVQELVSLIDIPPTIVSAAGLALPETMRGRPLQGLADGSATHWRQEIFSQISEDHVGRAVRTKKWKYEVAVPGEPFANPRQEGSDVYHEAYLYDLEADPHERQNLVRDPATTAVRAELAQTLHRHMAEAGELPARILPADTDE